MRLENLEEEGLPKKPILHIAQLCFLLSLPDTRSNAQLRAELMEAVTRNNLAPYYESLCKHLDLQVDTNLLNKMKKASKEELKRLEDELEDAENTWAKVYQELSKFIAAGRLHHKIDKVNGI